MPNSTTAITPTRQDDFPEWYQQVIQAADLAENSEVRGCMIIKPYGYAIWENIQRLLDARIKATGHTNAYFPLFVPLSYLQKEAAHVEGFAKECAIVTHHRLEAGSDGQLLPTAKLTEPLIIRPTSETIIGAAYARWTRSYRDLPILINQWANVVRWELRPRLFLRTTEFLWQEGHTAHETKDEAIAETQKMLLVYETFAREILAIPVIPGAKTPGERFPGALDTLTIEAMVQDRKAVQTGTSHFLGQNFSRAYEIKFLGRDNLEHYAWTTSWGVSTRLIGTLIMTHSDDDGLVLPPRIAPYHLVIIPFTPKEENKTPVIEACRQLTDRLRSIRYHDEPLRVHLDSRDLTGSAKSWEWIKKGVPIRIEIGPRDLAADQATLSRRDRPHKEKISIPLPQLPDTIPPLLDQIQHSLYQKALSFRDTHTHHLTDRREITTFFTPKNPEKPEIHGGFLLTYWGGTPQDEEQIKNDLKITVRCLPHPSYQTNLPPHGTCPFTGKTNAPLAILAKAY
ncbi:MAG: proline--tRNA ligase [Verrucomicrobiae bacterium]|nr:proline--tRNA ligase [Verrucomicrobiae bacterium]